MLPVIIEPQHPSGLNFTIAFCESPAAFEFLRIMGNSADFLQPPCCRPSFKQDESLRSEAKKA
jgi:hypothetical protein